MPESYDTQEREGAPQAYRQRVILFGGGRGEVDPRDPARSPLAELRALAETAGAEVVGEVYQRMAKPTAAYYIGKGKAEAIRDLADSFGAELLIADNDLSPGQVNNLEELAEKPVIDRTELILDIFATHARTQQAKIQVELAQLEYTLPRLKRMWTHLEKIKGGIGFRGPGEKQIEVDRRLISKRIGHLKSKLREVHGVRKRQIEAREDAFKACLVGYTNAGKSTLMNRLTDAGVRVEDKLFATLDTRTRAADLGHGKHILLSDTVGFIRKLPHRLVESFKATLEEAVNADLLIHIVDAAHYDADMQIKSVNKVLTELKIANKPVFLVFNKVDAVRTEEAGLVLDALKKKYPAHIEVSALNGLNIEGLKLALFRELMASHVEVRVSGLTSNGRLIALIEERAEVLDREFGGEEFTFLVRLDRKYLYLFTELGATVYGGEDGPAPSNGASKTAKDASADEV